MSETTDGRRGFTKTNRCEYIYPKEEGEETARQCKWYKATQWIARAKEVRILVDSEARKYCYAHAKLLSLVPKEFLDLKNTAQGKKLRRYWKKRREADKFQETGNDNGEVENILTPRYFDIEQEYVTFKEMELGGGDETFLKQFVYVRWSESDSSTRIPGSLAEVARFLDYTESTLRLWKKATWFEDMKAYNIDTLMRYGSARKLANLKWLEGIHSGDKKLLELYLKHYVLDDKKETGIKKLEKKIRGSGIKTQEEETILEDTRKVKEEMEKDESGEVSIPQ